MGSSKYIPVGLRDRKLIGIHEFTIDESGDLCNCSCPECKLPLIACSMECQRAKHFRHKSGEQHCHFKLDKFFMDYIMEFLSSIESVPGLIQEDFLRMNVKANSKVVILEGKDGYNTGRKAFKVVEAKGQRVKIRIEDTGVLREYKRG